LENTAARLVSERTNYLNKDIVYLKNTVITEYDIKSAGFNVIKFKKLLPSEEIQELDRIDKEERNIRIGKRMIKYPNISEEIINTLAEVRSDFVILNNIQEEDVLSIKKDAIFVIKKMPRELSIKNYFNFVQKESYTSYCYLNNKEFYYSSRNNILDIKGLSENIKNMQEDYFLNDIKKIMSSAERLESDQIFSILKNYRTKYLSKKLDKETYRDLDTGLFRVGSYTFENISDEMVEDLDISQNYIKYLVPLFSALV
jgi:hypothetical protein